jgi:hypothetical protein
VTPKPRIVAGTVRLDVKPRRLTKAQRLRQQRLAEQWKRKADAKSVELQEK